MRSNSLSPVSYDNKYLKGLEEVAPFKSTIEFNSFVILFGQDFENLFELGFGLRVNEDATVEFLSLNLINLGVTNFLVQ